jgi:polysaccharide chain length determinant protein (PEP-CTERM system associated)
MATPTKPPVHALVQDFLDQLRGAWRFRWIALAVAWAAALALWLVVFLVPDTYEASARVFVDAGTTLGQATQGIGLNDNIDSQIQRVRQALLGGPQLEKVAEQSNLLVGTLTAEAKQQVVDRLRKDIDITGNLPNGKDQATVFTITYKNRTRARALQVVDRLLNTFVEGSLGGKQQGSQQAEQFLVAQIADYGHRLSTAEQRIADFKKRNAGLLPGQGSDYFTRLQSENDELTKAKESLNLEQRKAQALQKELHAGQPYIAGSAPLSSAISGASLDIESQIADTQKRLDELLLKYTDQYPDVIQLKETLKELQARQKAELAAAKHGDVGAATRLGLAANPVYQHLQDQYNQEQVTIASMEQDITDREQGIANLKSMMSTAPQVEAQYSQLTRDLQVNQAQYNELLQRLNRARLGQQADATGIVKFEVIDPPTAKFEPVAPNRPLLIAGALIAALAAGAGAAYLLHLLRPVFVSTRQLAAVTGLPVLGSVGMAWIERFHTRQRRGGALYVGGAVALVMLGVGVLLLQAHLSNAVRALLA